MFKEIGAPQRIEIKLFFPSFDHIRLFRLTDQEALDFRGGQNSVLRPGCVHVIGMK